MPYPCCSFETAYSDLLAELWDELEDLIDACCGGGDAGRIRLKLGELRRRVVARLQGVDPASATASRLRTFGDELLRLLDVDAVEGADELPCGASMVLAQSRILDEAQRLALMR